MAPLGSVLNFTITWHHLNWLQIWPLDGATCHLQEDNFAIWSLIHCFQILATTWRYLIANLFNGWCPLHQLQIWPPSGTTCIGSTFSHQVVPLALFSKLATRLRNLRCHIALDCPIGVISLVLSLYPHQLESHQLSFNKVSHSCRDQDPSQAFTRSHYSLQVHQIHLCL